MYSTFRSFWHLLHFYFFVCEAFSYRLHAKLREANPDNALLQYRGNAGSHDLPFSVETLTALSNLTKEDEATTISNAKWKHLSLSSLFQCQMELQNAEVFSKLRDEKERVNGELKLLLPLGGSESRNTSSHTHTNLNRRKGRTGFLGLQKLVSMYFRTLLLV
ncbi:uncharacterized protein [Euphorbia lathyris]|uniref:uncharacterized protein n=1 Tax=Euphorbia lathyris TaxID=212925 RepID=UPI00331364D8